MPELLGRFAGLSYSKHRDAHGLAGVDVLGPIPAVARVSLARSWPRARLSALPSEIGSLWRRFRWQTTAADQLAGHHLLQELSGEGVPVAVFTTQKDLKDPKGIERLEIQDKVEQVQFAIWLRQVDGLRWPHRPTERMAVLEEQLAQFSEHKTEAGSVDYYAPGEERDELVKALLAALFSARALLEKGRPRQGFYGAADLGAQRSAERAVLHGHGTLHALLQASDRRRPSSQAGGGIDSFAAEFEYATA